MDTNQGLALNFDYGNKHYQGEAIPASSEKNSTANPAFDIFLDDEYNGTIVETDGHWTSDNHIDSGLIAAIGSVLIAVLVK